MLRSQVIACADKLFSAGGKRLLADRDTDSTRAFAELADRGALYGGPRLVRLTDIQSEFMSNWASLAWESVRSAYESSRPTCYGGLADDLREYVVGKLKSNMGRRFLEGKTSDMKGASIEGKTSDMKGASIDGAMRQLEAERETVLADIDHRIISYCSELRRTRTKTWLSASGWVVAAISTLVFIIPRLPGCSPEGSSTPLASNHEAVAFDSIPAELLVDLPQGYSEVTIHEVQNYTSNDAMTALQREEFVRSHSNVRVQWVGVATSVGASSNTEIRMVVRAPRTPENPDEASVPAVFDLDDKEALLGVSPGAWVLLRGELVFREYEGLPGWSPVPTLTDAELVKCVSGRSDP